MICCYRQKFHFHSSSFGPVFINQLYLGWLELKNIWSIAHSNQIPLFTFLMEDKQPKTRSCCCWGQQLFFYFVPFPQIRPNTSTKFFYELQLPGLFLLWSIYVWEKVILQDFISELLCAVDWGSLVWNGLVSLTVTHIFLNKRNISHSQPGGQ